MTKRRRGTDEQELFEAAMRGVKPLPKPARAAPAGKPPQPVRNGAGRAGGGGKAKADQAKPEPAKSGKPVRAATGRATARTAIPGLDRRTATRLRRGQLAIDGRLDLHGHSQEEAHRALHAFVRAAARRGQRCVLVITGKGGPRARADGDLMPDRDAGVLRRNVPRWLNEAPVRELVLGVEGARPQHGGGGAYYVLLRRQRD